MTFVSLKGRGIDVRLDGTLKYIQDMHLTLLERLDNADKLVSLIEDKYEHIHGALSSLNRDVKKLESKPDPIIPIVPSLQPLRADIAKLQAHVSGLNDEMGRCLNTIRDVWDNGNTSALAISRRIDSIKIPVVPKLKPLYYWLTVLTITNLILMVTLYVK